MASVIKRNRNNKKRSNEEWSFEEEVRRALEESEEYTINNEKIDTEEWEEREKDLIEFVEYIFGGEEDSKDGSED